MWPGGAEDKSLLPKMGPWAPQLCARHCTILLLYTLSHLILRGTQRRGHYCFHFRGKQTVSGVMCSFKAKQPANGAIVRFCGFPDDHLGAQVIEAQIRRASTLHPLVATGAQATVECSAICRGREEMLPPARVSASPGLRVTRPQPRTPHATTWRRRHPPGVPASAGQHGSHSNPKQAGQTSRTMNSGAQYPLLVFPLPTSHLALVFTLNLISFRFSR